MKVKIQMKEIQELLRARNLEERGKAQVYIDKEVLRLMSPYTPKANGALIDSAEKRTKEKEGMIGTGKIFQGDVGEIGGGDSAPYARKWYYTSANFTGSPTRGTHWFERAMNNGGRKSIFEGVIRMTGAKKK